MDTDVTQNRRIEENKKSICRYASHFGQRNITGAMAQQDEKKITC
jgi:hypothetical protein